MTRRRATAAPETQRPPHGGSFTRAKSGELKCVASTAPAEIGQLPDMAADPVVDAPAPDQQQEG